MNEKEKKNLQMYYEEGESRIYNRQGEGLKDEEMEGERMKRIDGIKIVIRNRRSDGWNLERERSWDSWRDRDTGRHDS